MQEALDWIRGNDVEIMENPDSALVSALSIITGAPIPKKKTAKKKKKFVEDSINWLQENDPGRLDTVDDPTAMAFTNIAGISYEGTPLSAVDTKNKAMQEALDWIRGNDVEIMHNPESALVSALSKITGAPMPKKKTAKNKKKFVEDSINWLQENDPGRLDTVDDPTAMAFT